ncbi:MAG: type II toxin-antitoxin system HicA family toxin [archaeon YNP-LCB-024-027]|nr:type II toxin-antitoxin system HicA family toxin [Candidatus Culexarchaeum yellowstonense]
MSKLPVVSGREVIKYLTKKGFVISRQKGSHVVVKVLKYYKRNIYGEPIYAAHVQAIINVEKFISTVT